MTEQDQRIAIAEACGWIWYRQPSTGPWAKKPMRSLYHPELMKLNENPFELADMTERECNPAFMWREGLVPDYLHDLNAMHEAESRAFQAPIARLEYRRTLENVVSRTIRTHTDNTCDSPGTWEVFATAAQRAEAFLRTIGKWVDDPVETKK